MVELILNIFFLHTKNNDNDNDKDSWKNLTFSTDQYQDGLPILKNYCWKCHGVNRSYI